MGARVVEIELTEDCGLVADVIFTPRPQLRSPNFVCEGQLCPRKYANGNVSIFWGREADRRKVKSVGGQLIADLGWPRFDVVKAVIAHRGAPYVALSPIRAYQFSSADAINQKLLASYSVCDGSTALAANQHHPSPSVPETSNQDITPDGVDARCFHLEYS
jgi:hypothetical protein